jgi:hypothetical protein
MGGGSGAGANGSFQTDEVISRVLARDVMVARVQKNAPFARWVIKNAASEFLTAGTIHHDCPDGVASLIHSEGEGHTGIMFLK